MGKKKSKTARTPYATRETLKQDAEYAKEIKAWAVGRQRQAFVKGLAEYFTPTEMVLIVRIARETLFDETGS